ncbi:MAG: DUF3786 domain-containing protein [Thermoleophilia bacterium]
MVDIYKELPRTNCGDCGKGSCFAFATAVYLEAFALEACPHLSDDLRSAMGARLEAGRESGEGRRPSSPEQALRSLLGALRDVDLEAQAAKCGGEYRPAVTGSSPCSASAPPSTPAPSESPAPPSTPAVESVAIDFLDGRYVVTREDVSAEQGEDPSVWVKILLLIYLTRAGGRLPTASWVSYRDLPNSVSKSASFEECSDRIARAFEGDLVGLERAVISLGGRPAETGSADLAYVLPVLPRVPVLLLFWDREEEFDARAGFLLDGSVLDYLDLEALLFVGEALAGRLLGEGLGDLVA